jgi:hypothetical protein
MSRLPGEAEFLTRLRGIGEDPSGAGAADPKTAREAGRLLRRQYREHGDVTPPADYALGLYYWRRSLVLSGPFRQASRKLAVGLLGPIFLAGAQPLPVEVLSVVLPGARRRAERALRAALRDGDADQLGTAAGYWRRIAAVTPDGDPAAVDVAEGLGVSLINLFDHTGDPAELDDTITFYRSVLAHLPAGMSAGPVRTQLAMVIVSRCSRFGSADVQGELGEAIALLNSELATCTPHDRPVLLSALSGTYTSRAELTETAADADVAVELARQAVELAGRRHSLRPVLHTTLISALMGRYNLRADPKDLGEAIRLATVTDAPVSDRATPAATGQRIITAVTLASKAQADPGSPDLDHAIDLLRTATSELPDASPLKMMLLQALSTMLWQRFFAHGSAADLDAAIEVARFALALEGGADPQRQATALMMLSWLLSRRYEDAGDPADVDAAVTAGQNALERVALEALPSASLRNWAVVLLLKYDVSGETTDLEETLRILRHLVSSAAAPVPTRVSATVNLAQALLRDSADQTWADLDEAVQLLRQALSSPEIDASTRARVEHLLATALAKRFNQRATRRDADEGLELLDQNLKTTQLSAGVRAEAAVLAAELEQSAGEPGWISRAADRLAAAVELLPFAAARTLVRADRQRVLGGWQGLAARAAALALADERPGEAPDQRAARALGLLEAGRTVLLNQAYDTRGDLYGVWRADPILARRFLDLRAQLDHDPSGGAVERQLLPAAVGPASAAQLLAFEAGAGARRRTGLAFAEVIEQIRKLPGQSGFMRTPDLQELTAQATHGPIVVLNVAEMRGDAFLLTSAGVRALRLPALTANTAADAAERLHQSTQALDAEGMLQVLDWLWSTIARPILEELGFDRTPTAQEPWPRIWWVAGGALANMPLHAAGRYRSGPGTGHDGGDGDRPPESVLDRVISSYAPNVRTLRYLRERSARSAALSDSDRGSLIVAMCQTPGTQLRDLANAGPEADLVAGILPKPVLLTHGTPTGDTPATPPVAESADQPTTGRVLSELARSRMAHFACHAEADTADPSRSGLRLLDAPLTVSALGTQDLDSVAFAFLSACSTALNRAQDLLDESIHVVSAFQLAGIPQVVGTLWEVEDFASLAVVQSFYTRLGARGLDISAAAETLHEITRLVRDEVPDAPWIWAAHMYAGC